MEWRALVQKIKKVREKWLVCMNKHALIDAYIHHRNLLNKGRGEISWFSEILKIFGVIGGIAFAPIVAENLILLLIGAATYLGLCYVVGWWWEVRRYYHRESEWGNKRNPLADDIRAAIKSPKSE